MKIALISTHSTSGKTTMGLLLGGVGAQIFKTPSYLMTTGSFDSHFNVCADIDIKMRGHTPEIRAALRAASVKDAESFSTSLVSAGLYPICEFSDPSLPEEKADVVKGFASLLDAKALVMVEICNDAKAEDNRAIIESCDVAIIIARPIMGEYENVKKIIDKYKIEIPHVLLLNEVNPLAVTTKELQVWFPEKFWTFSYNPAIPKFFNKRKTEQLVDGLLKADYGTGTLRQEIYNLLSKLYHPVKIPEVSRWA